jgi:hypothetical protein
VNLLHRVCDRFRSFIGICSRLLWSSSLSAHRCPVLSIIRNVTGEEL